VSAHGRRSAANVELVLRALLYSSLIQAAAALTSWTGALLADVTGGR
jgi:hypothetical protein